MPPRWPGEAVRTYSLSSPQFLEPGWFARVRSGQHPAVMDGGGSVLLDGVALRVVGDAPVPGAAVKVWVSQSGFFVCAEDHEIERAERARQDEEALRSEQRRKLLNERRAMADSFNAKLALPVKWDVGIKDVLSGLSERSMGDGRSKATVEHIYLLEPLQDGRMARKAGDFLCTPATGSNGKRWSSKVVERAFDGDGSPYQPMVTCKACLSRASKWMSDRVADEKQEP